MRVALSLARRQAGQTAPNPNVGAVIVKDGQIIAHGITAKGGRPHAETQALADAGEEAQGARLYVTLEPCSHHGKTPPCAEAIIKAGISEVIIACRDKNPIVNGAGIKILQEAGIKVIENICEQEALEVNRGFFSVTQKKRPYIALKIAASLDGKITSPAGQWLTGEQARNYGQLLRSQHDAILTGSGTVIADDPLLTCRLPGLAYKSPLRIILDRSDKIPPQAKLLNDGHESRVMSHGLEETINEITKRGITSLFVEAGAKISSAFLENDLVDRLYLFRAPIIVGNSGLCFADSLYRLVNFKKIEQISIGVDSLEIYEKHADAAAKS